MSDISDDISDTLSLTSESKFDLKFYYIHLVYKGHFKLEKWEKYCKKKWNKDYDFEEFISDKYHLYKHNQNNNQIEQI